MLQERREEQFQLVSQFQPQGDQPQAIEKLAEKLKAGKRFRGPLRGQVFC
jgi:excinuclease UvrABC helicase subunit UvrB